MWEMITELDVLAYELECAIDNSYAVHTTMEADGGINWQRMCNAVYCAWLQMGDIQARMCDLSDQTTSKLREQKDKAE